jgi:hypothetical protein
MVQKVESYKQFIRRMMRKYGVRTEREVIDIVCYDDLLSTPEKKGGSK